jgi:hypothetical protein
VKLSYRVRQTETRWHWHVVGPDQTVLGEGFAGDHLQARAQAMLFVFEFMGREPAKPDGTKEAP